MKVALPLKMILSVFPLGALAAVIVWFVYVGKYGRHGEQTDADDRSNSEKATIAFQGAVAAVAVYFALHHHANFLYL